MTFHVWAEVPIGDLARFLQVFGREGQAKREEHGCEGAQVFTPVGETGRVLVLLRFPAEQHFHAFRDDPEAPPIMRSGGAQGPPSFTALERVGVFDH